MRSDVIRAAARAKPGASWLLPVAAALFGMAMMAPHRWMALGGLAAGATLTILSLLLMVLAGHRRKQLGDQDTGIVALIAAEANPAFAADADGAIRVQNRAAMTRFKADDGATLTGALGAHIAAPAAMLRRLQDLAVLNGAAREDVILRRGHLSVSVTRVDPDTFLWRVSEQADAPNASRGGDGISLPMLTVSRTGTVLFMNEALKRLIGGRQAALDRIINDLPVRPGGVHEIAGTEGPLQATVVELGAGARRELYFLPIAGAETVPDWKFFDALPVPLLKIGAAGDVQHANRHACDLLGVRMGGKNGDSEAGVPLKSLVEGLGRPVDDWLSDAAKGLGLGRPEVVRATRPEAETYLQIALGRVESDDAMSLVAVMHDATELKTLEAQFVQSQKMEAIGQLAGGIAHDFNNLLTAISGHCDLLLLRHDAGDPEYGDLMQITENANRAASLVGQLLAFSRKQNMVPQRLDLRDTLADLTHLLNRLVGETVSLTQSFEPSLKMVRADKRQFEQVMMNLVVNARDAMPDGGEIRIVASVETLAQQLERDRASVPPGEYVVLRVSDQGSGIAPDKLPKIFEPFFTTKPTGKGTGLGLSTVYGIVKQSGGYIFADSQPGSGSCFTLFFPAHEYVADAPLVLDAAVLNASQVSSIDDDDAGATFVETTQFRDAVDTSSALGGVGSDASDTAGEGVADVEAVVLLVEDEAPVRAFASRALRMRGYRVIEAENAEEALKTLEDDDLTVDVFVTDVIMPGMDGPGWVSQALKQRPDTRVVFVSGYAEDSVADSRAKIPNSVFLPKPFSLTELTSTVRNQLH